LWCGKGVEGAVLTFKHAARSKETGLSHARGTPSCPGGPARMQPFCPGSLGKIFNYPRCHAAGSAERGGYAIGRQAERRRDPRRRAECSADCRGMEALTMHGRGRNQSQAANQLRAHRQSAQNLAARQAALLRGGQQGRHHHRTNMDRRALKCVVVVLAMYRHSVDESSRHGIETAGVPDRRARPIPVGRGDRRVHVIAISRRHHETQAIQKGTLQRQPHLGRNVALLQACRPAGKNLGDADLRKRHGR
jgi:hypothetical protein